jgi:hypothetical protein
MSMAKFYDDIARARKRTEISKTGAAWFRGIPDGRYTLLPGLFRIGKRHADAESNVFADFWTKIENVQIIDNWERISYMQHYGVPTRLLDWTEHLNIAVYFAIAYSATTRTGDPCIWVMNPFKLNELYCNRRVLFDAVDKIDFDYYAATRSGFPNELPVAIRPTWSNARIRAQAGGFTVHGRNEAPLDDLIDRRIAKRVAIPHEIVYELRKKIRDEGTDHFSTLRGPEGLARNLSELYLGKRFGL